MSSMLSSVSKSIAKFTVPNKSRFEDVAIVNADMSNMTAEQWVMFFIVFIALLFILMFLGAIVFNMTIPKIIPSIRKVSTVEFFGLYVILHILFC